MIEQVKAFILTLIFNFRYNQGWLFAIIAYLIGGIAMLYIMVMEGYI